MDYGKPHARIPIFLSSYIIRLSLDFLQCVYVLYILGLYYFVNSGLILMVILSVFCVSADIPCFGQGRNVIDFSSSFVIFALSCVNIQYKITVTTGSILYQ